MKARTKVLLEAAEAALKGRCSVVLQDAGEIAIWYEEMHEWDFFHNSELRCLFLCFYATGIELDMI